MNELNIKWNKNNIAHFCLSVHYGSECSKFPSWNHVNTSKSEQRLPNSDTPIFRGAREHTNSLRSWTEEFNVTHRQSTLVVGRLGLRSQGEVTLELERDSFRKKSKTVYVASNANSLFKKALQKWEE